MKSRMDVPRPTGRYGWGMLLGLFASLALAGPASVPILTVYKDAQCGCCSKWIDHLAAHGIVAQAVDLEAAALAQIKRAHGVGPQYQSCHTAVTADGLVFEGHVPAPTLARFLAEHPAGGRGLAVPGMPAGSPGMETGNRFTPYQVWQLDADGAGVYEDIRARAAQYAPGTRP